ncbi:M15 family metallopeptidase [Alkalinema sp. FACHB-956]|nr:M15 family metallopeptidase [Alkalinema sp. FACHB-956]
MNGLRSDVSSSIPQPSSQVTSVTSQQPLRIEHNQNSSAQAPAVSFEKMVKPSSPKGTIVQPSSPIFPVQQASPEIPVTSQVRTKFGHFPYQEADPSRLVNAGKFVRENYERSELLDQEAYEAFQQMKAAAASQGVYLMIISGFRSITDQAALFERQIARRGSESEAARSSAPPGYSEHHTGYALDIADQQSDTDLKVAFQETAAYQWLVTNAYKYQFEQSFPLNNRQGINFEPWHWRYIGPPRASQIFAAARQAS